MKNSNYLLEKRRHGTVDFPCAIYQQEEADGPLTVSYHWHTDMEIIHLHGGTARLEVDMDSYSITEECFVFVNPEELHFLDMCGAGYKESAIVFDWSLLDSTREDSGQKKLIGPLSDGEKNITRLVYANTDAGREIKEQYCQVMEVFRKETDALTGADILRVKAALLNLTAIAEEHGLICSREKDADYRVEYLKRILEFIANHYAEKIKIGDMAQLVGMNEQYFCRFFKKMLEKTPVEYLNDYRIEKAKAALMAGNDSIMNIAMDCGFNHMGNFINMFKKKEKCTPSEYRNRVKMSK